MRSDKSRGRRSQQDEVIQSNNNDTPLRNNKANKMYKATYSEIVQGNKETKMMKSALPEDKTTTSGSSPRSPHTNERRFEDCTEFDDEFAYLVMPWRPPLEGLELYRSLWSNGKYKPSTPERIVRIGFSLR